MLAAFRTLDPLTEGLVPGTLYRPTGAGPFPGVVLLHGCAGVGASIFAWGRWLQTSGYEALVVNSMAPRAVRSVCVVGGHPTDRDQALDALGALNFLRSLPEIDPRRIAVVGWSHGGGAALVLAGEAFASAMMPIVGAFQAAVAFYPECALLPRSGFSAPTLILIGSEDDWASPQSCATRVPPLEAAGAPLEWHLYPHATHGFDTPARDRVLHIAGRSFTLRYDADAAADAHVRVAAFLGEHLGAGTTRNAR
jgi:dienelactone hydrolase